ncbi:hypothetical protein CC79DRAFT_135845 [Sarocladium strictum]
MEQQTTGQQPVVGAEPNALKVANPAPQPPPSLVNSTSPDLNLSSFYCEPPSKYSNKTQVVDRVLQSPPLEWLNRTWTVTHSTLDMWRSARNVRISYTTLPSSPGKPDRIDDLVEYEPNNTSTPTLKTVRGVDTRASNGWDWRGKSWLFFVTSHWEILGWGEILSEDGTEVVERWAVTWFAPTVFTKEGVDVYSDRPEGVSEQTYKKIYEGLEGMVEGEEGSVKDSLRLGKGEDVVKMWREDLVPVEIKLPWVQG